MNALQSEVELVNRTHAFANELGQKVRDYFKLFIGKKVLTRHGFVKSISDYIEGIRDVNPMYTIFLSSHGGLIYLNIRGNASIDGYAKYKSVGISIGCTEYSILTSVSDNKIDYRCDFTSEEIEKKRERINILREEIEELNSSLGHFCI